LLSGSRNNYNKISMSGNRTKVAILILASLTLLSSCKKKNPNIPQPQSQAPTLTLPGPKVQPEPPPQPQPLPQSQQPAEATNIPEEQPTEPITKPKTHRRRSAKKVVPPPAPEQPNTSVKEGGDVPAAGQLSAGIPEDEATRQRRSAAELRNATEKNLQNITRQLSSDEQAMVQQIRAYVAQSRSADEGGDIERAYNLAVKANLLSGELAKR
jgi:outer membrane biosynthesis protein TonB